MTKRANVRRYTGALTVDIITPSTGAHFTVATGDEIELDEADLEAIDARPDFEPLGGRKPAPDPEPDEGDEEAQS